MRYSNNKKNKKKQELFIVIRFKGLNNKDKIFFVLT